MIVISQTAIFIFMAFWGWYSSNCMSSIENPSIVVTSGLSYRMGKGLGDRVICDYRASMWLL